MIRWARWLSSRRTAWAVVILSLALTAIAGLFALRVEHDDDLLAFLPRGNADVAAFYEINKEFGSLDVALVGIEADDPFEAGFLNRLGEVTRKLNEDKSIHFALSVANVPDFTASAEGGIVTDLLIPGSPAGEAEEQALREKVMSRDMVVGQLVSSDAHAVLIYCFSAFGTDPRTFAGTVERIVREDFPTESIYWGGAPFVSTYIYTATQDDLRKLTPWAVLVVILLVILSFRDLIGALLSLVSTGMGIAAAVGLMGVLGIEYNLVLSSMPVILFSCGSAYAIHVIARYYQVVGKDASADPGKALEETLATVGPTVLAAGLTTVAGLSSFLAMDIAPMRTFGLFSAFGILVTLILSLTFVPAVIVLVRPRAKRFGRSAFIAAIMPVVELTRLRPRTVAVLLVLISLAGARYIFRVDNRMDQTAFFTEGSPPDRADRFLLRHFGGATFIEVAVDADFTQPETLRELERLSDRIATLPAVSNVQHIGQVISQVNEAMEGERRIPDDGDKVQSLYRFLTGNSAVSQLVTAAHHRALVVVKVRSTDITEIEETLAAIEQIVVGEIPARYRLAPRGTPEAVAAAQSYVMGRIRALLSGVGISLARAQDEQLRTRLASPAPAVASSALLPALRTFLGSDECLVDLGDDAKRDRVAGALAALAPGASEAEVEAAIAGVIAGETIEGEAAGPELIADLAGSVRTPLVEIRRRVEAKARAEAMLADLPVPAAIAERVAQLLPVLDAPRTLVPAGKGPADGEMSAMVNGLPVLHRGLSASSTRNQLLSMTIALLAVLVILMITFRSLTYGLIASSPMFITLLVIYGGMGWLGVHLDIGTSMLASIVIGAGVDYSVHLLVAWRRSTSLAEAVERAGPAIWTNALMVAAGFFVLTLGEARPLQNVGGLTAAAMLTAALSTFVSIPLLGGWMHAADLRTESESVTVPEDSPKGVTS